MKILLTAVNAKFTHMNPALYSIKAFAGDYGKCMEIAEYTINQYPKDVLKDIYSRHPDVIGFSCYIWNMKFIGELLEDIGKILPSSMILLGGPEAAYNTEELFSRYECVDGIFTGEGEYAWRELAKALVCDSSKTTPVVDDGSPDNNGLMQEPDKKLSCGSQVTDVPDAKLSCCSEKQEGTIDHGSGDLKNRQDISAIPGLVMRNEENPAVPPKMADLDEIPFVFDDLGRFRNRMVYYETSRGCPFRCSYCLSSIDKSMRFRSLDKVYPELQFFLDNKVRIVKFTDRTFNADPAHAMGIWRYLAEHDNGVSRFHFEIEADLLTDEELEFLSSVRKGLFQLEIGVQSANPDTLKAVNRHSDISGIRGAVLRLKSAGNIPVHVDLIAGLPFEDLRSFRDSFNEVYSWGADELQLGFLKVLKGTGIRQKAEEFGLVYENAQPYEVLSTKWLSYDDIIYLKDIEEQLERYGNSGSFKYTIREFEKYFSDAFSMYGYISGYFRSHQERFRRQSRISTYEMLRNIIIQRLDELTGAFSEFDLGMAQARHFDALLLIDMYAREKLKVRPAFFSGGEEQKQREREYKRSAAEGRNIHVEFFGFDVSALLDGDIDDGHQSIVIFNYNGQGAAVKIEAEDEQGRRTQIENLVSYDIV